MENYEYQEHKVEYIDHMGDDLSVVNAARVSQGSTSDWEWTTVEGTYDGPLITDVPYTYEAKRLSKADKGLLKFLARGTDSKNWDRMLDDIAYNFQDSKYVEAEEILHKVKEMPAHWSPFAHTALSVRLIMPIMTARQIMKHNTGIEYNEISRRYVKAGDKKPLGFLEVDAWRGVGATNKQGSGEPLSKELQDRCNLLYSWHMDECWDMYQTLMDQGVCAEQARMCLPQSMMVEVIATGNLYAWMTMYKQRIDSHAQHEAQLIAQQLGEILQEYWPESFEALTTL